MFRSQDADAGFRGKGNTAACPGVPALSGVIKEPFTLAHRQRERPHRIGPAMIEILSHRTLYRDPRFHAAFPTAATLADGTVLVVFRRGRDHRWLTAGDGDVGTVDHLDARSHHVLLRCSAEFEPLGPPTVLPADAEAADQDPNLLALRDGRLLLSGFSWYPLPARAAGRLRARGVGLVGSAEDTGAFYLFWGGWTRTSDDGGRTWSPHAFLPPLPGHGDVVPGIRPVHGGAVRGRAVETADGTLLLATYGGHPYESHLFASTDGGATWGHRSVIAADAVRCAGFCETALHRAEDGRLLALHRTTGLDDRIALSVSGDLGHTWAPWVATGAVGHPADLCPLGDGRVLVVYGHRHPPYGVRARLWAPAAGALDDAPEVMLRDDAPGPDVGYPWAVRLGGGRAAVCHYIVDDDGIRHIAATLLAVRS